MNFPEGAPAPVTGSASAAAGDTARTRPPRPVPPARAPEPLTASQHREWLLQLAEHLSGEVRLCEPDEWAPEPISHREAPNIGDALDAWFLLEATLDGHVVRVVSECGYTYTSKDGSSYHQLYASLKEDGKGTAFLAYGDPAAAVEALRRKVRER